MGENEKRCAFAIESELAAPSLLARDAGGGGAPGARSAESVATKLPPRPPHFHGLNPWHLRMAVRDRASSVKVVRSLEHAEFHYSSDGLVGILSQLTQEVERLDSMIRSQRHLLQLDGADFGPFHDRLMHRQLNSIRAGAADMATRALSALEQLRAIGYAPAMGWSKPD
jgi:hypothetical protein